MKRVMVFGTFDTIHSGHLYFLARAIEHGDFLIVVVARDNTVKAVKGRFPKNDGQTRLKNIERIGPVDAAVLGCDGDKYKVIEKFGPDVICLGYDQRVFTENLEGELSRRGLCPQIVRLAAYKEPVQGFVNGA